MSSLPKANKINILSIILLIAGSSISSMLFWNSFGFTINNYLGFSDFIFPKGVFAVTLAGVFIFFLCLLIIPFGTLAFKRTFPKFDVQRIEVYSIMLLGISIIYFLAAPISAYWFAHHILSGEDSYDVIATTTHGQAETLKFISKAESYSFYLTKDNKSLIASSNEKPNYIVTLGNPLPIQKINNEKYERYLAASKDPLSAIGLYVVLGVALLLGIALLIVRDKPHLSKVKYIIILIIFILPFISYWVGNFTASKVNEKGVVA